MCKLLSFTEAHSNLKTSKYYLREKEKDFVEDFVLSLNPAIAHYFGCSVVRN